MAKIDLASVLKALDRILGMEGKVNGFPPLTAWADADYFCRAKVIKTLWPVSVPGCAGFPVVLASVGAKRTRCAQTCGAPLSAALLGIVKAH